MNGWLREKLDHTPGRRQDDAPRQASVASTIDLYDSDILKIESVIERLNREDVGKSRELEDFVQKTKDLFAEIGLRVDVLMWTSTAEGVYVPEITINGRVDENHEFDYDRQVHEVTNDLLELGEGGVISTKKMKPGA